MIRQTRGSPARCGYPAGVARTMTTDEIRTFLTAGTRTGKLATVRADGRPHVAPIWFVLDGDDVVFNTHESSVKAGNLRRDPRVAITVDSEEPPYAFVIIEGTAALSTVPGDLLRWATAIGGRYMGAERADEFGRRNGVPGEYLVRVTPTRIIGKDDVAGY